MKKFIHLLFLLLCIGTAQADTKLIDDFFKGLKTLKADFTQSVENAQLSTVDQSSGTLWISRPGKFRWDYKKPYEQQIVSNGDKIWIYDTDLEQVTVQSAKSELGQTPAMLLSSNKPLEDSFSIKDDGELNGLHWIELGPKKNDAGFDAIRLGFKKGKLKIMLMQDNLGQITEIQFKLLSRNVPIDNSLFEFKVPEGVDVFDSSKQ